MTNSEIEIDKITDYVVFDVETTGFSPRNDKIIEIGAVKVRDNKIVDELSSLIKIDFELPSIIKTLTGISDEDLFYGEPEKETLEKFVSFVGQDYLIGHNVKFDINFVSAGINRQLDNEYFDTMTLTRRIFKNWPHYRLKDLKNNFNISEEQAHRALSDVKTTYHAFNILKNEYKKLNLNTFFVPRYQSQSLKLKDKISFENYHLDETSFIYNKKIVFTGSLNKFKRNEAIEISKIIGAIPEKNNVTKSTNILVVGDIDYKYTKGNKETSKMKKAKMLIEQGQDLIIITESDFLDIISQH